MNRSLAISRTGMEAQQTRMDVTANNLANVSTTGFKKSRATFEELLYQNQRQAGGKTSQQTELPSGLQLGTGVRTVSTERMFTQGNLEQTGNDKDMAINGQGFFQVLLPDGTTSYTRDGSFQIDNQGQIVTASGYTLQPALTIPPNATSLTVGRDGVVTVTTPDGPAPVQIGTIQLAMFINPAGLQSKGENLYNETSASGAPQINEPGINGTGVITQGYVETSNVNVVEELVNMIQTQRAYEINSKSITTTDQMLAKLTQM